jgi:hypothetical protein
MGREKMVDIAKTGPKSDSDQAKYKKSQTLMYPGRRYDSPDLHILIVSLSPMSYQYPGFRNHGITPRTAADDHVAVKGLDAACLP